MHGRKSDKLAANIRILVAITAIPTLVAMFALGFMIVTSTWGELSLTTVFYSA